MNAKIETDTAAKDAADEIVTLTNSKTSLAAEMEAKLAEVRATYAPALEQLDGRLKERTAALKSYCTRKGVAARLFPEGRKFAESPIARFGWRDSAPSLKTLDTKEQLGTVAARLAAAGRVDFVIMPEPKPEINKPAIMAANMSAGELAELGLRIVTPSTFYIEARDRVVTPPTTSRTLNA